ncbi:M6 family metalloprotease domain-containing protein [Paenibacillus peoriae]|uniref:M6 family metalloprotease domain-containing protein n=1 Tax=Paenibacillus peoriae TaxID=59893 RepID=UPI00215A86DD|nr:M6 family metalloprotease domain-containing protein [Paenibacillus peoriae]
MSRLNGEVTSVIQDNKEIELRVYGDEFYARHESLDGYTAIYDQDAEKYCYAILQEGKLVTTGIGVDQPAPEGLQLHIKEDSTVRSQKFMKRFNELRPRQKKTEGREPLAFGPYRGLIDNNLLTEGEIHGLTVLVEFADLPLAVSNEDIDDMLNGENYHGNGNYSSVRKYFETMSSGRLKYINHVVGPVKLPHNRSYYTQVLLVEDAMDILMRDFNIDLSEYDSKRREIVDAVNFFYAGPSISEGHLWPHNSEVDLQYGSYKIKGYMLTGAGRSSSDLAIGTFCHETGHLLCRFCDIYDYGERDGDDKESEGIGEYCLMGSGNHLNNGHTPSPICAYQRKLVGWYDNEVNLNGRSGRITVKHGDYNTIYKYNTDKEQEYFLVENRANIELDKHLPSSGLAIYHCDILGSNENQDGGATRHYQVALMQADGNLDLEKNRNRGDRTDLFGNIDGVAFAFNTNPSSIQWDTKDSGFKISNITNPAEEIEFTIG